MKPKKALFLYYSQTGQTQHAMDTLAKGFAKASGCDVESYTVVEKFTFPWKMRDFFRAFPRCVLGLAPRFGSMPVKFDDYDLVILGGQVWFLSPSLPLQSLLQSSQAEGLKGKPVIVLVTCRNLWYSAARLVRESLQTIGAKYLGQITVCEISPLWASFVTTPRWMLTGKKEPFAFFPAAGIREGDFTALENLGQKLGESWVASGGRSVAPGLLKSNLDRLSLRLMDRIGRNFFQVWARTLLRIAPKPGIWQDFCLILFRLNLVVLIVVVAPCTKVAEVFWGRRTVA